MSRCVFYVFMGASGAGKDFAAGLLGFPVIKFASPYKRMIEKKYRLPSGSLDFPQVKRLKISEDWTATYLDLLMREYHRQKAIYETDFSRYLTDYADVVESIQFYIQNGIPITFTDVRNTYEVELIQRLAHSDWVPVVVHELARTDQKVNKSDEQLLDLVEQFFNHEVYETPDYYYNLDASATQLQQVFQKTKEKYGL